MQSSKFNLKFKVNKNKLILVSIITIASFFRFYGVNWDQGHHLHPDERFLTMVATAIKLPATVNNYLNPEVSTMSPYNNNYSFFVYGTLPLNLVKVIGEWTKQNAYDTIHLLGRQISAFFDIGVVFLVFLIGRKLWSEKAGLWSAFLYSIMVLPIQLSHFFAVDTFLNFFIVLSFYFLIRLLTSIGSHFPTHLPTHTSQFLTAGALGVSFGSALACKISAIYFSPIIALGFLYLFIRMLKMKRALLFAVYCLLFVIPAMLTFRFGQPQAFSTGNLLDWNPNPQFLANIKELQGYSSPDNWFPPSVQWKSVKPVLFPFGNLVMWGLGLPLGLLAVSSVIFLITRLIKYLFSKNKPSTSYFPNTKYSIINILVLLWILGLFFYQGSQSVSTMRYFLPIYPFLALVSAMTAVYIIGMIKKSLSPQLFFILNSLLFILLIFYPISFLSIYSHPITRVTASEWIFNNIPSGSTLLNEEWDDGLPIGNSINQKGEQVSYSGKSVFMYDEDTLEKWAKIQPVIDQADYYITSSNRAYGSLMRLPKRNPETIKFYESLFDGTGDFYKVAEFTSRPCFPPFGDKHLFCFNDDNSEEAFTVYDHPKVMIFQSKRAGEWKSKSARREF